MGAVVALVAAYGPFWRDVSYWMERAVAHAERQEWPEALRYVGRALDGAPEDPDILTFAGHLHREVRAWPEAADHFGRALDVDAGRPEPSLGLAESRLNMGDTASAADALRQMRMRDADTDQRDRAVALAEVARMPALALELLDARADQASSPDLRRTRARLVQAAGREQEALQAFSDLRSDGLLDTEGALSYAWMLNERGAHEDALSVLEAAPPSPAVSELAARTALWADRLDAAEAYVGTLPRGAAEEELSGMLAQARDLRRQRAVAAAARAEAEAEAARRRDTPPTDPAEALDFWRLRLGQEPGDARARAEVVALLEAAGRFDEARAELLADASLDDAARRGGDTAVHAARLSLWAGRPEDAIRLLSGTEAAPELLARAYLEVGDAERAYAALSRAGNTSARDGETLLLAARVADAAHRPTEAAASLTALARVRPLDVEERRWLAGLLWRSGGLDGALASYEGLRDVTPEDPSVHRAIGDLRLALDDPAGAEQAYRRALELGGAGDPAGRGLALALSRQGRGDAAVAAYRSYLEAEPDDAEARLGLARSLSAGGDFHQAGTEYERALDAPGSTAPELAGEVVRAWMAAGEHERAESWARRAASDPDAPLARARLAHLLQLTGRHAEAQAAVAALASERADAPREASLEGALVDGWIQRLQGHAVGALAALDDMIPPGDTSPLAVEARVFQAEVLESRGDLLRTRRTMAGALQRGATPTDVRHVQQSLSRRSRPVASAGVETGTDARELDVTTFWGRLALRPATLGSPALSLELRHRSASQLGASGDGTTALAGADSLFVTRSLRLDGRAGLETIDGGSARLLASLSAVFETRGALRWTLDLSRMPVWSEARRRGAPEYARVANLGTLDPALMVHEARGAVSSTPASPVHRSAHGELGIARYSDGNHRFFGYGQWRLPVAADAEGSLAVVPNVYAEGYDETLPSYASPSSFAAVGLAAEAVTSLGRVQLDVRANPHAYRFPGSDGVGFEGRMGLGLSAGAGWARVEARYLKQGSTYDLVRFGTEVSLPLGGAPR